MNKYAEEVRHKIVPGLLLMIWSEEYMELLLNRPFIYHDESEVGFTYRLARANNIDVNSLDFNYPRLDDDNSVMHVFLHRLKALSDQNVETINILYYWCLKGFTLPQWKQYYRTRFCPLCLKKTVYHRTHWSLSHYTCCDRHMVYLIENCYNCKTKLTIEDIVEGECKKCGFELCNTPTEETELGSSFVLNNGLSNSPYLTLVLSYEEQLKLVQRLSYCLIYRTRLIDVELSSTEKAHLQRGFFADVKLLHEYMNLSCSLLEGWPSKLVFFLIDYYRIEYKEKTDHSREEYRDFWIEDKVKEFIFGFIYHSISEKIEDCLWLSYNREHGFRNCMTLFSETHIQLDSEYICVEDVTKMFKVNYGTLFQVTQQNHVKNYVHPRNGLSVVEQSCLIYLNQLPEDIKDDYVSFEHVAEIWGIAPRSVLILCEMFKITEMTLFNEPCYPLKMVYAHLEEVGSFTTLNELQQHYRWDAQCLLGYLKRRRVNVFLETKWGYVYQKQDVLTATENLSNDLNDYVDRKTTISILGKELFSAAQLEVYYKTTGSIRYPYYLKKDIKKIQDMYMKLGGYKEVHRYRQYQNNRFEIL